MSARVRVIAYSKYNHLHLHNPFTIRNRFSHATLSNPTKRTHIFHIITCSCSFVSRILSSRSSAWKIPNINRVGWDESDQRIFEGVGTNCMWVYAGNVTAHSLKRVACLLIKMWSMITLACRLLQWDVQTGWRGLLVQDCPYAGDEL